MKPWIFGTLLLAGLCPPLLAEAEPTATDRSLAQSLFEQSKTLMETKRYSEACPKLEESQRLDPSGGTLLNLALCRELEGKVATAWSDFKDALSLARRDGREDRVQAAQEHIAALEPKLPWLTIEVLEAVEGEAVSLDGSPMGKPVWGAPVSIDPGVHRLQATAAGYAPWADKLDIKVGARLTVTVPRLDRAGVSGSLPLQSVGDNGRASQSTRPANAPEQRQGQNVKTLGWVIGGAGVAAVGVGSYFGLRAIAKRKDSDNKCPTDTTCSGNGVDLNNQAKTAAWVSNVSFGIGLVGIAIGTYLIWATPASATNQTAKLPRVPTLDVGATSNGGQISMRGVW